MSWLDENRIAFDGLKTATRLVHTLAGRLSDTAIDDSSCVAISIEIDRLLMALLALGEANTDATLDDEITELLSGEES